MLFHSVIIFYFIYILLFLLLVPALYCFLKKIVANNMCLFYLLKQIYVYFDVHFYESSSSFSYLINSYWCK